jgi:hypothetical protein
MTSSRESMRQELRELAKLADTMRKDRAAEVRSSGEWSALGPDAMSPSPDSSSSPLPAPPSAAAPPSMPSFAPVFGNVGQVQAEKPRRRRVVVGVAAGALAVGALIATGAMGRSLRRVSTISAPTVAAAQAPPSLPPASEPAAPDPVVPAPAPTDGTAATVATGLTAAPTATDSPPSHHPAQRAAPAKWQMPRSDSAGAALASKKAPPPPGAGSLDDLIRKAVATPPK